MSNRVFVLDDDRDTCELIEANLKQRGCKVMWALDANETYEKLRTEEVDVLLSDLELEHTTGLDVCKHVAGTHPDLPVIVITGHNDMKSAVGALRAGAFDFIIKPIDFDALSIAVERAIQHRELHAEVRRLREATELGSKDRAIVGESKAMAKVYELIDRVADADASVLIAGESGTGKELVARALHEGGSRADQPFLAINCAAIPANLLESELFGHVRGAFTDAKTAKRGLLLDAGKGTVFLDEIGEMPLELQPKLLRVIQERSVRPVGGSSESPVEARFICATNRDIEDEIESGRFREDLFYRLNVVQIDLPPLRSRGNDILLLAQHFLNRFAKKAGKAVTGIAPEAAKQLLSYEWPGNVRQLENTIERAVTLTQHNALTTNDLPERIAESKNVNTSLFDMDAEYAISLAELEKRYIQKILELSKGNKTRAAQVLGLDRRTLYRKLERYDNASGDTSDD